MGKKEFLTVQLQPPFSLSGFNFVLLYGTKLDLEVTFFCTDSFELEIKAKEKEQREEAFCLMSVQAPTDFPCPSRSLFKF